MIQHPQLFHESRAKYIEHVKARACSNPKYPRFTQNHFTAGDEEQFWVETSRSLGPADGIFSGPGSQVYANTFRYIFHKFKKGIFVAIRSGQIACFLPFTNAAYTNEWSARITNVTLEQLRALEITKPMHLWYANNFLFRADDNDHFDTNVDAVHDMLKAVCSEHTLFDATFFVNKRDFPILRRDGNEAYDHVFGDNVPLVSHAHGSYAPIFGFTSHTAFCDIAIPTASCWMSLSRRDKKYFVGDRSSIYENDVTAARETSWQQRQSKVVFRGSNTGFRRTAIVRAFQSHAMCDFAITKWQTRPRIVRRALMLVSAESGVRMADPMSTAEQARQYRFVLNVDGHVTAYRLFDELRAGLCVLLVASPYHMWLHAFIKPYVHYVPVAADCSDLDSRIAWCLENDATCERIASNAASLSVLNRTGLLETLAGIIRGAPQQVNVVPPAPPRLHPSRIPLFQGRSLGLLRGVELACQALGMAPPTGMMTSLDPNSPAPPDTTELMRTCDSFVYTFKHPLFATYVERHRGCSLEAAMLPIIDMTSVPRETACYLPSGMRNVVAVQIALSLCAALTVLDAPTPVVSAKTVLVFAHKRVHTMRWEIGTSHYSLDTRYSVQLDLTAWHTRPRRNTVELSSVLDLACDTVGISFENNDISEILRVCNVHVTSSNMRLVYLGDHTHPSQVRDFILAGDDRVARCRSYNRCIEELERRKKARGTTKDAKLMIDAYLRGVCRDQTLFK